MGLVALVAYVVGSRFMGPAAGKGFFERLFTETAGANIPLGETMAFATLAMSQLVHAFNTRSSHSLFRVGFHTNKYMVGAFFASLLLMLVVLLFRFLRDIFGLTVLPAAGWWTVAGLALAPLAVVEIVKGVTALLRRKPREAGEESR